MPQTIDIEGVGVVEFPDGTSESDILDAASQLAPSTEPARPPEYDYLKPLPSISEAQLVEQPSDFWNTNAVQLMGDEEAPGGLPRIPVLGPEGSRLRSATEFAGSVEESVAGGLSAMTSRKGMAMLPALAVPYVGPAALAVMGAESVGAGMGEVVTGAELHDPRMAGSGFGQVLLGAPMLGTARPMIELPRSLQALAQQPAAPPSITPLRPFLPARVQPGERAGAVVPTAGEFIGRPGLPTQPKVPPAEVPGTMAEPRENVIEAIRNADARTIAQIQGLFPEARLSREQARSFRNIAFPPVPEPVRPVATVQDILGKPPEEPPAQGGVAIPKPPPEPTGGPSAISEPQAAKIYESLPPQSIEGQEALPAAQSGVRVPTPKEAQPEVPLDLAGNPAEFYSLPRLRALDARNDPRVAAAKKYYGARTIPDLARLAKARFEEMASAPPRLPGRPVPVEVPAEAPVRRPERGLPEGATETDLIADMSQSGRDLFERVKATKDEFTGIDATALSAADRRNLARLGVSFMVDRGNKVVASWPASKRVEALREKVKAGRPVPEVTKPSVVTEASKIRVEKNYDTGEWEVIEDIYDTGNTLKSGEVSDSFPTEEAARSYAETLKKSKQGKPPTAAAQPTAVPATKPAPVEPSSIRDGDTIRWEPNDKKYSPVEGIVVDVISNTEGERGFNILVPREGDPGNVVRVWENRGKVVSHKPLPVEERPASKALQAEPEATGSAGGFRRPKTIVEIADEIAARGIDPQASYGQFVKARDLKPEISASEWLPVYRQSIRLAKLKHEAEVTRKSKPAPEPPATAGTTTGAGEVQRRPQDATPQEQALLQKLAEARDKWKRPPNGPIYAPLEASGVTPKQFAALKKRGFVENRGFGPDVTLEGHLQINPALRESLMSIGRKPPEPPTRPETPAVPPPGPPEVPKEFGMAAGGGFGGRSFGLDMANLWQDIKALWQRRPIKRDMAQLADAMIDTIPANKGREAGKELRVLTQERAKGRFVDNALARKAAVFVIQAKGDPAKLAGDLVKVKGNPEAEAAIKYAQANWDALQPLAERTKLLLDEQINYERVNGIETEYENHYVPQRHENILTDRGVLFGDAGGKPGGTGFKKAKVFPDYASAIEAGYKPRNLDIADLVDHRVRTGQRLVNRKLWADGFRTIDDPYSKEPIMTDMVARKIPRPDGTVDTQYSAPQGYVAQEIIPGVRVAVRQGYVNLFKALTGTSQIRESAVGRAGLATSGWLKHQLLLLDTFHASRTMQTSLAARGKTTYEKGLSLLEYSDRALTDAVNHNLITSEMASWVRTPQPFEIGGKTVHMTPREVALLGQKNGLNVGRFADALYNEAKGVVGTNPFTRWLFEKLTRGAMVETFLSEFGRVSKANPTMDATAVSRKVARDINVLFGNLQRQGIIKNPAIRDLMQMVFLAPQWVESLTRRELRAVGQAGQAAAGVAMGKGLHVGTVAKTVGTGLAAYVALTQLLNYLSRGHSTLENEEGEHKLDAFIPDPTGESDGFWFSPLSVFGEITHDFIRYSHTEPTAGDVPQMIQENKLGPVGRSLSVLRSGEDPFGTKLPTTWLRVQEAGLALVPLPIGAKPLIQTVGQKLGVEGVQAPKPGTLTRQAAGSAGFKIEPYRADEAKMQRARQVNTYIEYWTKQARQLPMEQRRIYVERAMTEANFSPLERNKAKREFGEAGVFKYR